MADTSTNEGRADVNLAFLILAHTAPEQVARLVRAIHRPRHRYAIHIDVRSPDAVESRLTDELRDLPNVSFLPRRRCTYGGWGMVTTTLMGMKHLRDAGDWDFLLNLSGQDYPLRSVEEMERRLAPHVGKSFFEWSDQRTESPEKLPRLTMFHFDVVGNMRTLPVPIRRLPRDLRLCTGSQWFALAPEACDRLISDDPAIRRLRRYFRFTSFPDEGFIQTALLNSDMSDTVVDDSLRHVRWGERRPEIFTMADLPALLESPALFARKFDASVDAEVLDRLDAELAA